MSQRELPGFLLHGDADLGLPRPTDPARFTGKGFPEAKPYPEPDSADAPSNAGRAAREWLRHVEAGRIGGG